MYDANIDKYSISYRQTQRADTPAVEYLTDGDQDVVRMGSQRARLSPHICSSQDPWFMCSYWNNNYKLMDWCSVGKKIRIVTNSMIQMFHS